MRRAGHLFEEATSFASLLQAARRAMRGSGHGKGAGAFFFALEPEVLELRRSLVDGDYLPGPLRSFVLSGPKKRLIAVAPFRDRVVHHAVVGGAGPPVRAELHRGLLRDAQRQGDAPRGAPSPGVPPPAPVVSQDRRGELLRHRGPRERPGHPGAQGKDPRLLDLVGLIVRNVSERGKGLLIGGLTSQLVANVDPDVLGHSVKEECEVGCHIRYMDGIVVWGDDRSGLKSIRSEIAGFLHERLALRLKESATFINQRLNGLPFLGTRVFPRMVRILRQNWRRALRRLVFYSLRLERGLVAEERYLRCARARWSTCAPLRLPLERGSTRGSGRERARTGSNGVAAGTAARAACAWRIAAATPPARLSRSLFRTPPPSGGGRRTRDASLGLAGRAGDWKVRGRFFSGLVRRGYRDATRIARGGGECSFRPAECPSTASRLVCSPSRARSDGRGVSPSLPLPRVVDVSAVTNSDHLELPSGVIHAVQNAIVPDSNAVVPGPSQFAAPVRARIDR